MRGASARTISLTRLVCVLSVALLAAAARAEAQVTGEGRPESAFAQTSQTATADKPPRVTFELDEHPRLRLGRAATVDFTAKFDLESGFVGDEIATDPQLDLARRRLGVSGELFHVLEFEIERELEDRDAWRDVFVAARMTKYLALKAGKFKAPFSRAQLTSSHKLDFVHRPLAATALSPGRQVGLLAEGKFHSKVFEYGLGLFSESGANSLETTVTGRHGKPMVAARFTASPFRTRKHLFEPIEMAMSATIGERAEGLAGASGRAFAERRRFFPEIYVKGQRRRAGYELSWVRGPLTLEAEYLRVLDERRGQGVRGEDLPSLTAGGWYVSAVWLVAGERRPAHLPVGVTPLRKGGIELGFRVEELRFGSESDGEPAFRNPRAAHVLSNADRAMTLAINWYASRFMRLQSNAIRECVTDAERSPSGSSRPFWHFVTRLQVHL